MQRFLHIYKVLFLRSVVAAVFVVLVPVCQAHDLCRRADGVSFGDIPFSVTSPWNQKIPEGANFSEIKSAGFRPDLGANINAARWSHPIYKNKVTDEENSINVAGSSSVIRFKIPDAAIPALGEDAHMHVVDESKCEVLELWGARRIGATSFTAKAAVVNDLTDDGVYKGWHGVRAYGGSAIAGLIRKNELETGFQHALAIAVRPTALNRFGPNRHPYVWPASSADDGDGRQYSIQGNLFMGSRISLDKSILPFIRNFNREEIALANGLIEYGGYIVDVGNANMMFYAEPSAQEEVSRISPVALKLISRFAVIVR